MIHIKDCEDNRDYKFDKISIDTERKMITVLLNKDENSLSLVEVYTAIKNAWRYSDDLIKYPFPMVAHDHMTFSFLNGYHLTTC